VLSLEDLSAYKTLYKICEEGLLTQEQALLVARNMARAVAELHQIGLVHGDIASENILIEPATLDVKIIDFDISSKMGAHIHAAGNPDFVSKDMQTAIQNGEKVYSQFQTDLYGLALCCYLVLGDRDQRFFKSLSEESIDIAMKERMVNMADFVGKDGVSGLLAGQMDAKMAAEALDNATKQRQRL
jgi:serine/threonine protein kinase